MHRVEPLTRFFFALGHVALQHLVSLERLVAGHWGGLWLSCMGSSLLRSRIIKDLPALQLMKPAEESDTSIETPTSPLPAQPPNHSHATFACLADLPRLPQVFVERAAKAVRRMRMEREKRAAEERAERMAAGRTPGTGLRCCRGVACSRFPGS